MRVVALGFSCNNACVFCAQGELRATASPAGVDDALAAIEPGEIVALVGGEPTLDPRLAEHVRAAAGRGAARVLVQTNARRLAYRAYAEALCASSERLAFDVSLAGSSEAMHDWHTQTPGSFAQTARGLANVARAARPVGVSVVVTRSNHRHLAEIARLAARLGARAVRFALAEPLGAAARSLDRVVPTPELVRPHLRAAVDVARGLGLGVVVGDRARPDDARERFAGLGPVEEVPLPAPRPRPALPGGPARTALAVLGRPAPGRGEVRAHARRSGADLEALFPDLFRGDGEPSAPAPRRAAGAG
jgi:MoaA/NifB/PqqE/SkfB family radical SAM enzyme